MKQKRLVVGLLVMLAVAVSTITFAYWQNAVADDASNTASGTITIGEGADQAVTTTVTVGDQTSAGLLVPVGYADETTTFDNIDLTFNVLWEGQSLDVDGDTGVLSATVNSVLVDGVSYAGLFTISVSSGDGAIVAGTAQNVVINVEFTNEPADQAEYDAIANGDLVISFTFAVDSDMVA